MIRSEQGTNGPIEPECSPPGPEQEAVGVQELSAEEKTLRPVGRLFEARIQSILEEKPRKARTGDRFEMELAKAMVQADVDPAFIYAFQKVEVFVTQENSHMLTASVLKRWDDAVREYRGKAGQRLN